MTPRRLTKQECLARYEKSSFLTPLQAPKGDRNYRYRHVDTDGEWMSFYCLELNDVMVRRREGTDWVELEGYKPK